MIQVDVRLNKDLIDKVGEYQVDELQERIDKAYMQYGFNKELLKDGTVRYSGNDSEDDFACFGYLSWQFKKVPWFVKYVDRWFWYNNDCMPYEDWFRREDILAELGLGKSIYPINDDE